MTTDCQHSEHCRELFAKLSEYLDRELDVKTRQEIERHVETCIKCNACLETLKRTIEICRHVKNEPIPELLSERLKKMLEEAVGSV